MPQQYELTNLPIAIGIGNVMAVVSDRFTKDSLGYQAELLSVQDYYPFGLSMPGRSLANPDSYREGGDYRYGFNGKERDPEGLGGGGSTYDYGFRIYNPGIGKFLRMDPLAPQYPFYSPYHFAGNNPVMFIDLDGREPQIPTINKFKYGEGVVSDVVSVVDNSAINVVNGGIGLINMMINNVYFAATSPTEIPNSMKAELNLYLGVTKKYFNDTYANFSRPFNEQLDQIEQDFSNPETYEVPVEVLAGLFLTKNFKLPQQKVDAKPNIPRTNTLFDEAMSQVNTNKKFYHKGNLNNGKVNGSLSVGLDKDQVSKLNRSGKVHEFQIPEDVYSKWEKDGLIKQYKDLDYETGTYNEEIRFDASLSEELNKYIVE